MSSVRSTELKRFCLLIVDLEEADFNLNYQDWQPFTTDQEEFTEFTGENLYY